MTEKEKAKAYDEAIERAKKFYGNRIIEVIFPELKESEDEKIKNAILTHLKKMLENSQNDVCGVHVEDAIDWIEKQGEDKKEINNFDVLPGLYKCVRRMFDGTPDGRLLFEIGNVYKCLSKNDRAEFEVSYGHSIYLEDPIVCKYFIPFESKCEQASSQTNIGKNEQKSSGEIEPKFKVGNWYKCIKDFYGKGVTFDKNTVYYCAQEGCLQDEYGCHIAIVKDLYDNFKLWTIQDAEDGDVLACNKEI